jgi:hypothetical protein
MSLEGIGVTERQLENFSININLNHAEEVGIKPRPPPRLCVRHKIKF